MAGPALDAGANEFYAFHGQSMASIDTIKVLCALHPRI